MGAALKASVRAVEKPVLLMVDNEVGSRQALSQELRARYGYHYQIVAGASAGDALARLAPPPKPARASSSWSRAIRHVQRARRPEWSQCAGARR